MEQTPLDMEKLRVVLGTLTHDGYFNRYRDLLPLFQSYSNSCERAWEALEAEREAFNLPPKYTSYGSFRSGQSYHLNKKDRFLPIISSIRD